MKCSCNKFQIDEFPCAHVLAVTKENKIDPYQYCSRYYIKEALAATYVKIVHPIPIETTIVIPPEATEFQVLRLVGNRKLGKPKKTRHKVAWELAGKKKCERCG